jgi:hypothetical protein
LSAISHQGQLGGMHVELDPIHRQLRRVLETVRSF